MHRTLKSIKQRLTHVFGCAVGAVLLSTAAASAADVNGIWLVEDKNAKVEIYDCADKKCGKIVWLQEPNDENGNPKVDQFNKDDSKKSDPIIGLVMIWDMVSEGNNKWDDGTIYRASDGKEFDSEMELKNDETLIVKGCVLFFCPSQTWTRDSL